MEILIAGDTHGNLPHAQYLVKTAKEHDVDRILQLGDFGYWPHYVAGQHYLDQLNQYCNILNVVFYWIDGNHDKTSRIYQDYGPGDGTLAPEHLDAEGFVKVREYVRYAPRGHRWAWDGCKFVAFGGAYSVDKQDRLDREARKERSSDYTVGGRRSFAGDQWFPEEEMSDEDMARFLEFPGPVDVIVAHDKPRNSNPGWNRKDYLECLPNQDRLALAIKTLDPAFFFHGHLHYAYEDIVLHGHGDLDVHATRVIGLHCDPDAAEGYRGYRIDDSWRIFDTEDARTVDRSITGIPSGSR